MAPGDAELSGALARAIGVEPAGMREIAGGDVNRAYEARTTGGQRLFVKHRPGAPAGMYAAEAHGLAWLAEARALRVPRVVAVGEEEPRFLALEWIDGGPPAAGHDEALGRGLAALHRFGAPAFGLARDNFIATIPQDNRAAPSWPAFYRERRLEPLARAAADRGLLPGGTRDRLERLYGRLEDLCGPPEPPARLHGDLWGGNAVTDADGGPVLIDPAVYGGHREVDLAMMRLFGGFSGAVFSAYEEAFPTAPGAGDRVALYQLQPLLVHVNLFGASYVPRLDAAVSRYAG